MANSSLTQERLKELLSYDPETGKFRWLTGRKTGLFKKGRFAGILHHSGRLVLNIDKKQYFCARLAMLYVNGAFPAQGLMVDHINGNSLDDRWSNLRIVTPAGNSQNRRSAAKTKKSCDLLGAGQQIIRGRYRYFQARIGIQGKYVNLGTFKTPEEAHAAYVSAKRKLHPFGTL